MKIILFDAGIGSSNQGDDIIGLSAKNYLMPLLNRSYVLRFGTHVKNIELMNFLTHSIKMRYIDSCDYKFILGTNLLTSNILRSRRQWPLGLLDWQLYKDCIFMGVGATHYKSKLTAYTKMIYEHMLRKDIAHSVRDEASREFLSAVRGVNVLNTGCPSLWKLTPYFCQKIPCEKARNAVVTVSGHRKYRDAVKDQKMIELLEKNYEKIYLWVQTTEDEQYYKLLKHTKGAKKIYSLHQYEQVCKNGNVDYIGTRLHGGIYAMQCGVRALVVEIDQRAEGIRKTNHINTIKRECIDDLEEIINGNIKTEIYLREAEIKEWLSQFPYLKKHYGY